ncbi:MAG TPA: hypothetical protein VHY22_11005, partial [Chthoniobacteraceae bacterium]|nr:hypothetical protein [Chthoniobacteraceae bacterium]
YFTLPGIPSSTLLISKAALSMLLAMWFERALDGYCAGHDQWRKQTAREREAADRLTAFNNLITNLVGIEEVFRSGGATSVQRMDYAKDVRDAVENSATVKIASIAGYEFIGSLGKSLLFDTIHNKPALNVEVVVLNATARADIIKERAKALKAVGSDYNAGKLTEEIERTTNAMRGIADSRSAGDGYVKYYKTKLHPAFRIILTDTALFVSAYQSNCHGHQAPVLKIRRTFAENGPSGMSLYAAFAAHFENLKTGLTPEISEEF